MVKTKLTKTDYFVLGFAAVMISFLILALGTIMIRSQVPKRRTFHPATRPFNSKVAERGNQPRFPLFFSGHP